MLSEHELLTRVWGPEYRADSNTLAVHIRRLRHALDPKVGRIYGYIRNVPRAGYTFVALGDTKSCQDPDGAPGPDPAG